MNKNNMRGIGMRVAYLNTLYPALSHTFIEREIRAVRDNGIEVQTFSIRHPDQKDLLSIHHKRAETETFYILDGAIPFIGSIIQGLFSKPLRFILCLFIAQKISPPGLKAHGLHLIYALESIRLAIELNKRNLSHIHVHMANNGAAVAMLACVYDRQINYSMTVHGSAEFFNVDGYYIKIKVEKALFVRCISHFCRSQIMIWTDQKKWNDLHIIHCGVDTKEYLIRDKSMGDIFRVLFVGRLDAIKGLTILFQAFKMLNRANIDCQLDVVGEGVMKTQLMNTAKELGISERVVFSGAVGQDKIMDHYDKAHVLVISSFMEGIPVVLMEAMAKGLGVVVTNVGGISELIEDGKDGYMVLPGSVDGLYRAMEKLANNREMSKKMGKNGRQKIIQGFSIEDIGCQMSDLFKKYLTSSLPDNVRQADTQVELAQ